MKENIIYFVNLYLKTKSNKKIKLKEIVFSLKKGQSNRNKLLFNNKEDRLIISQTNLKEDLFIEKIEILKELGLKHQSQKYTEHKANKPLFRNLDGSYE